MPTFVSKPPAVDTSTTATFQFADTEAGVTYLCKLDAGTFQPCSNPVTYTGLATGDHHIDVEAQDAAGNVSSNLAYHWKIVSTTGQPFSIAGNAVNTIYPGGAASPINLVFTNPNTSPITVTDVTVTVSRHLGPGLRRGELHDPAAAAGAAGRPGELDEVALRPRSSAVAMADSGDARQREPERLQDRHGQSRLLGERDRMSSRRKKLLFGGKKTAAFLAAIATAAVGGLGAWAYFTGTGSGTATASTGTLSAPLLATPTPGAGTVSLSWSTVSPPSGSDPVTYYVQRDGGAAAGNCPGLASPSGVTSCTDSGLSAGTYQYTVTARWHSWTATSASQDDDARVRRGNEARDHDDPQR